MPQLTINAHGPAELRLVARYLDELALIREKEGAPGAALLGGNAAQSIQQAPEQRIAPADLPDAGMPEARDVFIFAPLPPPVAALPLPPTLQRNERGFNDEAFHQRIEAELAGLPSAPAATVAVPPAGVTLDKAGLPWDGRIHSTPAKFTEKGVWRNKRGFNDEGLRLRIEAELRATLAAPAPPATLSSAGAMAHLAPAAVPSALPLPPASLPPVVAPSPAADPQPTTLPALLQLLTPAMSSGALTLDRINAECQKHGVLAFAALGARPDLIPAVWAGLR